MHISPKKGYIQLDLELPSLVNAETVSAAQRTRRKKLSRAGLAGPQCHLAKTALAAPTGCIRPSFRESDDTYGRIVTMLNSDWRVICGSCSLQWIVQRRTKGPRPVWTNIAFCATTEGLKLRLPPAVSCDPAALAIIIALPAYFPKAAS
jgi:hypothetical protein